MVYVLTVLSKIHQQLLLDLCHPEPINYAFKTLFFISSASQLTYDKKRQTR